MDPIRRFLLGAKNYGGHTPLVDTGPAPDPRGPLQTRGPLKGKTDSGDTGPMSYLVGKTHRTVHIGTTCGPPSGTGPEDVGTVYGTGVCLGRGGRMDPDRRLLDRRPRGTRDRTSLPRMGVVGQWHPRSGLANLYASN